MEAWMKVPITFPLVSMDDISKEPIIVEVDVEGYLVRRVYVDEGASVERGNKTFGKNYVGSMLWFENLKSHSFNDTLNDEISHSKGSSHSGNTLHNYLRMSSIRKEASD
ncbi:hypothetical protein Tco_1521041 [Tanacetum coccineum]